MRPLPHSLLRRRNRRVLIVDRDTSVHDHLRTILCPPGVAIPKHAYIQGEFGHTSPLPFRVDSACDHDAAAVLTRQALEDGEPYALALMDANTATPPDALSGAAALWQLQPDLQVLLCSNTPDLIWDELATHADVADRVLLLRKPFHRAEVLQLTKTLADKVNLTRRSRLHIALLEERLRLRHREIETTREALHDEIVRRVELEANATACYQRVPSATPFPLAAHAHRAVA